MMKSIRLLLTLLCLWLGLMPLAAQSLEITQPFRQHDMASVLAIYKNQFGEHENRLVDESFPYAVIRVELEGDGREVAAAKEKLSLDLGYMFKVKEVYKDNDNEILFLVPANISNVSILCGDGCERKVIFDGTKRLQANAVYFGKVHFVPMDEGGTTPPPAPKRQFFKFRVTPTDAIVEVDVNGQKDIWHVSDGLASKPLNYGSYSYTISANRYHTETGKFVVSDTETEKSVSLRPKFGWLSIAGNNAQGAHVYATNTTTGARLSLGTVPVNNKDLDAGNYTILIQREKYKDYTTTVIIKEGETTTLAPNLEANFVQLSLTTVSGADMYIDGQKLGTGRWSGTLELGAYSIETRQASHHSAYTNVQVTSQSAGKTIALNNPIPIYGSMMVSSTPADATVYVDGKKIGTTPLIVNEMLIGNHVVRLEKEGYAKQEKTIAISEGQEQMLEYTLAKETPKPKSTPTPASTGGHEYVDLGLSVKWATCNVGANKPEDYGDYFAWGETKPKSTYNWSTYKWCRGSYDTQTKYNTSSRYGTVDNKKTLELSDDAARANWGGSWRMPTDAEWTELREKCKWTLTTQNGVRGYKVTSKSNGNSIFLPAAGYRGDSSLLNAGRYGYYWSSSLFTDYPDFAWSVYFYSSSVYRYNYYRYYGFSVRPVCP